MRAHQSGLLQRTTELRKASANHFPQIVYFPLLVPFGQLLGPFGNLQGNTEVAEMHPWQLVASIAPVATFLKIFLSENFFFSSKDIKNLPRLFSFFTTSKDVRCHIGKGAVALMSQLAVKNIADAAGSLRYCQPSAEGECFKWKSAKTGSNRLVQAEFPKKIIYFDFWFWFCFDWVMLTLVSRPGSRGPD